MPMTRSAAAGLRKSLDKSRRSEDFANGADTTVKYIWQYSETHQRFNPAEMNEYIDTKRKERNQRLFSKTHPPEADSNDAPSTNGSEEVSLGRNEQRKQNIKRSLKMLDDAVGSPRRMGSPLHRTVGTPGSILRGNHQQTLPTLKHSSYTPSGRSSLAEGSFDIQNTSYLNMVGTTPGRSKLGHSGRHFDASISLMDDSGYTKPVTPTGQYFIEDERTTDITRSTTTYAEMDAVETAFDVLLEGFTKCLTTLTHSSQVFQLVDEYEKLCSDTASAIYNFARKSTPGRARFSKRIKHMDATNQEKYTWRLIGYLFRDRLERTDSNDEDLFSETVSKETNKSEREIVLELYKREASTRRNQLVIDWLEKNSEDWLENFIESENVEYFGNFYNWENTLHSLEQSGPTTAPKRPFVTEMDPDAPVRQNRAIADLDIEDERRLLKHLFAYIRAGKLQQAQELCIKCGQAWRAATMEGWKLYHNPNSNNKDITDNGKIEPIVGNPNRDIWKNCCWNLSEQDCYNVYERAIYSTLGGNLRQILPACISWEDYLWAYFKVMVDVRVEQAVREASNTQFHVIQKYIILNDIDGLLEEVFEWLNDQALPSDMLRFMAHFILFLRTVGMETKDTMCVSILQSFVQLLIKGRHLKLVAIYTSHLPADLQVTLYAQFLEDITDKNERKLCFELAESSGLDIASITKTVVENIRGKDDFKIQEDSALEAATTQEDRRKIEAIEWLIFDPSQRAEAIKQSNAIMRCFIALKKHEAARSIFEKLPEDSIDVVHRRWQMKAGDSPLTPQDSNSVREYLCIKAYLDALETFDAWFEHFHRNAPKEPKTRGAVSFTQKVAFEQELKHYQAERDRWERALDLHTKETSHRIYNVLLFPGGWMIDLDEEDTPRESRARQLGLLRQLCIPFLTFLLQSVLSSANEHKQCLQLADIIASSKTALYQVFRKDELRKLLSLLRQSSIEILENQIDPLGYEMK
ncbi:nuclear pore complex protein Nup107-like [Dendronephthya gigantea]|uniref:nuclear pore complex protein Nup107-like n=1 Tax=Dendronephthya gigantea TaxID=151771 RepID=UPI00106DC260|nr:nuclear pore complex protein Nup107-like [Dendronephthya gigantea]